MRTTLAGRTVLVTGAGSGLGRLLALGAAARGASVVAWDLDGDAATAVAGEVTAGGGTARAWQVDVTDRGRVRAAAAEVGDVDVVVNNAGVVTGKALLEASEVEIERTFSVNTLALYWVTRAFLPGMVARGRGTVVTMASAAGLVGVARQTDYAASKFAAVGFAESLRMELRKQRAGVRSLVVCPYYVDTGMFAGVRTKFPRLLPILRPEDVVRKTWEAVDAGRSRLVLPPMVNALTPARLLPVPVFDAVVDFFGINDTMDAFQGRRGYRSDPKSPSD